MRRKDEAVSLLGLTIAWGAACLIAILIGVLSAGRNQGLREERTAQLANEDRVAQQAARCSAGSDAKLQPPAVGPSGTFSTALLTYQDTCPRGPLRRALPSVHPGTVL
jgi:hypothetical protein